MKKFYILALVAAMFAACATDVTEDVAIEVPETLKVSFEESSRIQLDDNKTVWTKGDLVSVFYRSDANQQWKFQGNTGDRSGTIKRVSTPEYSHTTSKMVVAYPYNENYYLNPETCNLQAFLPAEQTYLKDSYGINGNIMVSQSEYKQFVLKSVCGWLKIQLTGNGEKVQSIKLKGNNGEQVAGEIYVNTADATSILAAEMGFSSDHTQVGGTMVEDDTILTEVTLNCGDGVTLGSGATAFYIALPPQEFSKGLTIEIEDTEGYVMEQSTDKVVTIERNQILPMAAFEYEGYVPLSWKEIRYTATEKAIPYETNVFGANVVSNEWDSTTREGIITFDGKVTSIGKYAFYNCTSLTSVTIPDSVTEIGNEAFCDCTSLTSVTIGKRVTKIGYGAFYICTSLTSVTIGNRVTSIRGYAFEGCTSLTSVTIPNSVTEIGYDAFSGCSSLTSVTIPNSVTEIGEGAFCDCTSLTSVTIPNSVTEIGEGAFAYCSSLTNVTIGDSVTSIGRLAFRNCTSLTSVNIPNSVTEIGVSAFYRCTSLTSVTIPDSVTSIGISAFSDCTSLKEVYYNGDLSAWCKIHLAHHTSNPMNNGAKLYLKGVELTDVTIPSDITEIKYTFTGCTSLKSVTFHKRVTSIGERTFEGCTSLTSVTIPDSVTSIGGSAFSYCTSLTSVTIPDSVTSIGVGAFSGCTSLTSITIPDSVTEIGFMAFADCTSLKEVYCKPTTPPSGDSYMFDNNASGRKIYVPRASVDVYMVARHWSSYKSYIEPYDFE